MDLHPLSLQLMIANFLLSPPGLLKINNIQDFFPDWLCSIYYELYSPEASPVSSTQNPPPSQQSLQTNSVSTPEVSSIPTPDFGPFPSSLMLVL